MNNPAQLKLSIQFSKIELFEKGENLQGEEERVTHSSLLSVSISMRGMIRPLAVVTLARVAFRVDMRVDLRRPAPQFIEVWVEDLQFPPELPPAVLVV